MGREHRGIFYGILAAFLNSLIAVFIRLCSNISDEVMVFSRFFIGFLILLPFYIQGKIHLSQTHFLKHLVRGGLGLLSIYLYYFALKTLPVANAISLANTMPLFTPFVILIWLRLLVSKWKWLAAAIGFSGVLLMLKPGEFSFDMGSFAALGTGLCAAAVFVGIRQLSKVESTGAILFYYFALATLVSFIPCIYVWEPILEWKSLVYLACTGVLWIGFQYAMTLAFSMAPTSKVGPTVYLAVVFGGLFGWWIWGEVPALWSAAGIFLTILGGTLAAVDKTEAKKI